MSLLQFKFSEFFRPASLTINGEGEDRMALYISNRSKLVDRLLYSDRFGLIIRIN